MLLDMWNYLTGTKQSLWNVFNNAIQERSQDFPLEGEVEGGGGECVVIVSIEKYSLLVNRLRRVTTPVSVIC